MQVRFCYHLCYSGYKQSLLYIRGNKKHNLLNSEDFFILENWKLQSADTGESIYKS